MELPPKPGPWRLLIGATIRLVIAVLGPAIVLGGAVWLARHIWVGWRPPRLVLVVAGAGLGQLLLLWFAWRGGGLAWVRIARRGLLTLLVVAMPLLVGGWLALLIHVMGTPSGGALAPLFKNLVENLVVWQMVAAGLGVAVLAPVAEELFFRGFLWTGLRRAWPPLPVAVVTSLLWLGAHLGEGVRRPLFLLPMAVLLSLARHYCNSTRATILLHVINNSAAVGLMVVAFLYSQ